MTDSQPVSVAVLVALRSVSRKPKSVPASPARSVRTGDAVGVQDRKLAYGPFRIWVFWLWLKWVSGYE